MLRVLHTLSSYIHYVRAFTMASIWSLASHLCLFKSEIEPALAGPEPCLNLLLEIAKTSKVRPPRSCGDSMSACKKKVQQLN